MTIATARQIPTISPQEMFRERAEARAILWREGEYDLHEAVDVLQADAERTGLVAEIGQEAVQAILAKAFTAVRVEVDQVPAVGHHDADNISITPERVAASTTVEAVMYELRTYGIAQLAKQNCQRRLADLSPAQVREVIERLDRLRVRYPAVTDDLLLALAGLLP